MYSISKTLAFSVLRTGGVHGDKIHDKLIKNPLKQNFVT